MTRLITVNFTLPTGATETHTGIAGDTVLDVALDNGVAGILGQCGGGCTCCTCHCWVGEAWLAKLAQPHPDELDMLEYAWGRNQQSRLACQITLTDALDEIEISIPAQQS